MSIKPALTREEWAHVTQETHEQADAFWENAWGEQCERHETAARALLGQPFGFTREDVQLLRDIEGDLNHMHWGTREVKVMRLADRIEALLPPED